MSTTSLPRMVQQRPQPTALPLDGMEKVYGSASTYTPGIAELCRIGSRRRAARAAGPASAPRSALRGPRGARRAAAARPPPDPHDYSSRRPGCVLPRNASRSVPNSQQPHARSMHSMPLTRIPRPRGPRTRPTRSDLSTCGCRLYLPGVRSGRVGLRGEHLACGVVHHGLGQSRSPIGAVREEHNIITHAVPGRGPHPPHHFIKRPVANVVTKA